MIPSRYLSPERGPELLALETPFPPDDRSVGYERGTSVSKAWDRATTDAALEVTGYVATHLREVGGVPATKLPTVHRNCGPFVFALQSEPFGGR